MIQRWKAFGNHCKQIKGRLKKRGITDDLLKNPLKLTKKYFESFWIPDTFIMNAKSVKEQSQGIKNNNNQISFECTQVINILILIY